MKSSSASVSPARSDVDPKAVEGSKCTVTTSDGKTYTGSVVRLLFCDDGTCTVVFTDIDDVPVIGYHGDHGGQRLEEGVYKVWEDDEVCDIFLKSDNAPS